MKTVAGWLAVLALLLQCGGAFAQSSDYEIIESYKRQQRSLLESIAAARNLEECANLESEIGRLEADNTQHRKLLDDGLHPDTFVNSIATLRERLKKSAERISLTEESRQDKAKIETISRKADAAEKTIEVISRQNMEYRASIDALTLEVQGLSAKIRVLSEENTGLLEKIRVLQAEGKKDKESITQLKALTEKLNANIRDRDELIVKMMDSLFDEYAKSDLTAEQKKSLFANAQESDYVGKIIATIDGNLQSVERTVMMPQDLGVIKGEERKVSAKWNAIKPYVGKIYPDAQAGIRDLSRVDSRLADWKKRIDEATWKSIHQVFAGQNIDIGAFGNAGEFHARLLAYIDEQLKNPSREKYKTFKNMVWDSPIKDQWLPVIPSEELTAQQRAEIDERIALWGKKISTLLWRGVLIGVFVTVVLALAAVAILKKRKPQPAA